MSKRLKYIYTPIQHFTVIHSDNVEQQKGYIRQVHRVEDEMWPTDKVDMMLKGADICIRFTLKDNTDMTITLPIRSISMTSELANAMLERMTSNTDDKLIELVEKLAWRIENFYHDIGVDLTRKDIYITSVHKEEEDGVQ